VTRGADDSIQRAQSSSLLIGGVKSILRCDQAEVIAGIADYVVAESWRLSILSAIIERTRGTRFPSAVAVFGALRAYLQVRFMTGPKVSLINSPRTAVWVARFGNERRALEVLPQLAPEIDWGEIPFGRSPDLSAVASWTDGLVSMRRLMRLARVLQGRYSFYQVLRALELTGFYMRYLRILGSGRFALAAVSNHGNPHGIAFALAARKCGIPVILLTHGMPIRPIAKLSYDLAVVHCDAARRMYEADGCVLAHVLVHSRRAAYAPMPRERLPHAVRVGVFLCKDVREGVLARLVRNLLADPRVSEILIRAHPTNLWRGLERWIAAQDDKRLRLSTGGSVAADVQASDIVFGGNSSVLVDAVVAGRPAAYVRGIDCGPDDLHGFVANGLIFRADDDHPLEPEKILAFYQRSEWGTALRDFANIDEEEAHVAVRFADALRKLFGGLPVREHSSDHSDGVPRSGVDPLQMQHRSTPARVVQDEFVR